MSEQRNVHRRQRDRLCDLGVATSTCGQTVSGSPSHLTGGNILVVDDEPQILLLVSRFLRKAGFEVETAEDGFVALERLNTKPFALILSDLKMPRIDGLHLLQEVNEQYPDTLFILMTGFATVDSAISVLRRGAYDYLTKPMDLGDLRSTVQRALEHRALMLQNKHLMEFLQEKNVVLEFLHREEQRRSEQLNQVNAIAQRITAILDVDKLVTIVIDLVKPAFDFASLSFGLIEGEELFFRGGTSPHGGGRLDGKRERAQESLAWRLTDGGRKVFVRPAEEPLPETAGEDDADQAPHDLIFPLRTGGQAVGFWVADWREDAAFREENLPYLESLAAQTVVVLENARLYALARQADELAFLNEVERAANQSLDLDETIRSVLLCVRATFNASVVEVCLLGDPREPPTGAAEGARQSVEDARASPRHPGGQSVDGAQVFSLIQGSFEQNSEPVLGNSFVRRVGEAPLIVRVPHRVSPRWTEVATRPPGARSLILRSLLGVSLRLGERQIGVLGLGSTEPGAYDTEDGRLLQVVGGQVAAAIENARLFREVESGRQTILQSRNTLQTLFDGILEGIYIVDRSKEILAINRTQAGWAHLEFAGLVGRSAELAFPASRCSLALIEETFESGEPLSRTERQRMADGRWTEWEIHTYPIFKDARAGPSEIPAPVPPLGACGDSKIAQAISLSPMDFRGIPGDRVRHPGGTSPIRCDRQGHPSATKRSHKGDDLRRHEGGPYRSHGGGQPALGRRPGSVDVPPDKSPGVPQGADHPTGAAESIAPWVDVPQASVDRVVVVVRDVTEQRWLEASLIQSEKLAAVGRLAAGVAHEINNPMTVVSANVQILREEIPSTHPYYGSIELIDRASERTSKIVRNLLDFSRAEQFEFVPTDLNRSLLDAISLVRPQIRKSNIEVITELDPALPPIWASPDHLHVVWLNLLLNARDAIEEAEREGWIRITSRRRGEWVVVHMSDNGMGIPSHVLNRIYDPFFTTKPPGRGTGLGLFTCYRTVTRHRGEISVDSEVGVGTHFDISLPIQQEPDPGV